MAHTTTTTTTTYHRPWHSPFVTFSNVLVWICSAIVLGITAWFTDLSNGDGGRHLMYQLVVAVLTLVAWPAVIFLSRRDGYYSTGRFLMPLALAFSYLWLAATVVSIDDWVEERCQWTWPPQRCAYKHTVIAFNFLAFFFICANLAMGSYLSYYHGARPRHGHV